MKKISVIGAGKIGALAAHIMAQKKLAEEIVLVDIDSKIAEGQASDISQSISQHSDSKISAGSWKDVSGSFACVISCGAPRGGAGSDRMELLSKNLPIIKEVAENAKKYAKGAAILTMTNPSDVMNYFMQKISGVPESRALGFGNSLDSARFRYFLSKHLSCRASDIRGAYVAGEHGDAMVPLFSNVKIRGKAKEFPAEEKQKIGQQIKYAAWDIVKLKGATEFGPASCVADVVEAIAKNTGEVMPVSLVQDGVSIGVLARIGRNGAEPAEMKMDESERKEFEAAQEKLRKIISSIDAEDL